eukprot:Skav223136  [mRNA]  locus=scaffold470:150011:153883:+ [translate_table: standard]
MNPWVIQQKPQLRTRFVTELRQPRYALLDVDPSVKVEDLRLAYRRAIRQAHPDKGGSSEAFLAVARAFDVLSNPATRLSYDQELQAVAGGSKRCHEVIALKPRDCRLEDGAAQDKLSNLREALQSMDASTRRASISNLPLRVRGLLVKHMETSGLSPLDSPDRSPKKLGSSSIRLRAVTSTKGATKYTKYSAQMDIDCLRSYTRQVPLDLAIEHQLVLSDLRDKLLGASEINPSIWCPPYKAERGQTRVIPSNQISRGPVVCDIFNQVFSSHRTSPQQLGLSVFVQLRASEWVANRYSLTSPVMSFDDAVALRFRLISARTWPALRQDSREATAWICEWLQLLQSGRRKLEETSAVALVDAARLDFLQRKLQTAVKQAGDHSLVTAKAKASGDFNGTSMGCQWDISGTSMGHQWDINGTSSDGVKSLHSGGRDF